MILTKLDKIQMKRCILSNVYALSAKASSLPTLNVPGQKKKKKLQKRKHRKAGNLRWKLDDRWST